MINFQDGIKVIKDCDFKISSSTTMAEAKEAFARYILKANNRSVSFMSNVGLNLEQENLVVVFFSEDGLINAIDIHPNGETIKDAIERKEEIAAICRGWLSMNDQSSDYQKYAWGSIQYIEDFDRWYFIGISIVFNRA